MIQELLGGGGGLIGERKISITGGVFEGSPSSSPPPTATSSDRQNLRCPRCDSSNTKFCYYNNYNLTQPRHFCKTCRRYWTQGGALRNVPIGGGCRKNKNPSVPVTAGKTSTGKIKTVSSEIGKSIGSAFDNEVPSNPILWASPQNSHMLALLRATQNPNPISNTVTVKDEGIGMIGSHLMSESAVAKGTLNARTLNLDPLNQVPLGLCSSSFWRNNQQQQEHNHHLQQQQHHGFLLGEVQNAGIQELYQRLRSQASNCYTDYPPMAAPSNVASSSSAASSILEQPAPFAGGGEVGFWNPILPWSNLPTTNGAYP